MRISFVCPSCNQSGFADEIHIGKNARCRQCGARFTIPNPDDPESAGYALEELPERQLETPSLSLAADAAFVSSRASESFDTQRPRRTKRSRPKSSPTRTRKRESSFPWTTWLIRCGIALVLVLAALVLFVPQGSLITGCILMVVGGICVLVGYGAGAYGAFREDSLYGFLYLIFPLYTAYYMVTRWEDLVIWLACSTVGVGLMLAGIEIVRWAGVTV
jgi:hypothetical protein